MPTLLIQDGFKFFFYANEHLPMHVHAIKGDDFARIDLMNLDVSAHCMKKADLKKALAIVVVNRDEFVRKWNDFFSTR